MTEVVVDEAGRAVVSPVGGGVPTAGFPAGTQGAVGMGRRLISRVVYALPVAGVEIVPALATEGLIDASFFSDARPAVVGNGRIYVARMLWASRF